MINFVVSISETILFCLAGAALMFMQIIKPAIDSVNFSKLFFYLVLIVVPALTVWYELGHKNDLFGEDDYEF